MKVKEIKSIEELVERSLYGETPAIKASATKALKLRQDEVRANFNLLSHTQEQHVAAKLKWSDN